jgi:peroxiredoxin Q/BCP
VKSHKKFCDAEELTFPLLADTDHAVAELYGAWNGKISRNSVLIDEKGNIVKTFEKVDPATHPKELLDYIKNL